MSDVADHAHGEHPVVPYGLIFGALMVMTVITVAASRVDLGGKGLNVGLALLIASIKGGLVMAYFMHLKFEQRIIVGIAMLPFLLAGVLVLALFPDIVFGQFPIR